MAFIPVSPPVISPLTSGCSRVACTHAMDLCPWHGANKISRMDYLPDALHRTILQVTLEIKLRHWRSLDLPMGSIMSLLRSYEQSMSDDSSFVNWWWPYCSGGHPPMGSYFCSVSLFLIPHGRRLRSSRVWTSSGSQQCSVESHYRPSCRLEVVAACRPSEPPRQRLRRQLQPWRGLAHEAEEACPRKGRAFDAGIILRRRGVGASTQGKSQRWRPPPPLNPLDLLRRRQQDRWSRRLQASSRKEEMVDLMDPPPSLLPARHLEHLGHIILLLPPRHRHRLWSSPPRWIKCAMSKGLSHRPWKFISREVGPYDCRRRHWAPPWARQRQRLCQPRLWRCLHRQRLPSRSSPHRCCQHRSSRRHRPVARHHHCPRHQALRNRCDEAHIEMCVLGSERTLSARLPHEFLQSWNQLITAVQRYAHAPSCRQHVPHMPAPSDHSGHLTKGACPGLKRSLQFTNRCAFSLTPPGSSCSSRPVRVDRPRPRIASIPAGILHHVSADSARVRASGGSPPTVSCPQVCARLLPGCCRQPGLSFGTAATHLQCKALPLLSFAFWPVLAPPMHGPGISCYMHRALAEQGACRKQDQPSSPRGTSLCDRCTRDSSHYENIATTSSQPKSANLRSTTPSAFSRSHHCP